MISILNSCLNNAYVLQPFVWYNRGGVQKIKTFAIRGGGIACHYVFFFYQKSGNLVHKQYL